MKIYAGVGSRKTPPEILELMIKFAEIAGRNGWILRSGGAQGADQAFEMGCDSVDGKKEIFYAEDATEAAREELVSYLDAPHYAILNKRGWLDLHARNCMQVLGKDLKTPVQAVICWTPDGALTADSCSKETGGTGTAIKIADANGITVYNLARPAHVKWIKREIDRWIASGQG